MGKKAQFGLLAAVVLAGLLVSGAFQGTRAFYETSEGRYAECAREMIASGDYLFPTLDSMPHLTKPPLAYWSMAAGAKLAGPGEWGMRLFLTVAFTVTVGLVATIGRALWGPAAGVVAAAIFATSPLPAVASWILTTDTLLALFTTAACACFVQSRSSPAHAGRWLACMWAMWGLAFLTKGPPALFFLLGTVAWRLVARDRGRFVTAAGLLAFAVFGLTWYGIVAALQTHMASQVVGRELMRRVASADLHNSEWHRPFTLYLPALAFGAGWWVVPGWAAARRLRWLRPEAVRSILSSSPVARGLAAWVLVPLVLFSLVRSRLPLYLLPLFPAVSLVLARTLLVAWGPQVALRRALWGCAVAAVALTTAKGVFAYLPSDHDMRRPASLCRAHARPGMRFVSFQRSAMYGLQYYLDGNLRRARYCGRDPYANLSIRELLAEVASPARTYPLGVLAGQDRADECEGLLRRAGGDCTRHDTRWWSLFVVPEPGGRQRPREVPTVPSPGSAPSQMAAPNDMSSRDRQTKEQP